MKILDKLLNEYFLRVIKRGDKRKEEDYDEVFNFNKFFF